MPGFWDTDPYIDEEDDGWSAADGVTCNRCGKTGLEWGGPNKGKFTLFNEMGKPHQCNAALLRKQVTDDFEDLTKKGKP